MVSSSLVLWCLRVCSGDLLHSGVRTPVVPTLSFGLSSAVARSQFVGFDMCFQVTMIVNYIGWSPMHSGTPPVVADSKLGVLVDPTA